MSSMLDEAVDAVRRLPQAEQDEIARTLLRLARPEGDPEPVDPDHLPSLLEGLEQAGRREFATEAETAQALRRFGP